MGCIIDRKETKYIAKQQIIIKKLPEEQQIKQIGYSSVKFDIKSEESDVELIPQGYSGLHYNNEIYQYCNQNNEGWNELYLHKNDVGMRITNSTEPNSEVVQIQNVIQIQQSSQLNQQEGRSGQDTINQVPSNPRIAEAVALADLNIQEFSHMMQQLLRTKLS